LPPPITASALRLNRVVQMAVALPTDIPGLSRFHARVLLSTRARFEGRDLRSD
jgi:hypothetical protein